MIPNLGAKLEKGSELLMRETQMEAHIAESDLIVTGEGRLDAQSVMGKTLVGIAKTAKKYGIPVIAFAGCVGEGRKCAICMALTLTFPSHPGCVRVRRRWIPTAHSAYATLADVAEQAFRLLKNCSEK